MINELASYTPPLHEVKAFESFRDQFEKFFRGEPTPIGSVNTKASSGAPASLSHVTSERSFAGSCGFKYNEEEEYLSNLRASGNFIQAVTSINLPKSKTQTIKLLSNIEQAPTNPKLKDELESMRDLDNICDLLAADDDGVDGSSLILTAAQFREYTIQNMRKRAIARKKKGTPPQSGKKVITPQRATVTAGGKGFFDNVNIAGSGAQVNTPGVRPGAAAAKNASVAPADKNIEASLEKQVSKPVEQRKGVADQRNLTVNSGTNSRHISPVPAQRPQTGLLAKQISIKNMKEDVKRKPGAQPNSQRTSGERKSEPADSESKKELNKAASRSSTATPNVQLQLAESGRRQKE